MDLFQNESFKDKEPCPQEMTENPSFYKFGNGILTSNDLDDMLKTTVPNMSVCIHASLPSESVLFNEIISMWNTPHRGKCYILVGVRAIPDSSPKIVGLRDDTQLIKEFTFFNDQFVKNGPQFAVFETHYKDEYSNIHRIGVYEIYSSENCGISPALIIQDIHFDDGSIFKKAGLWVRFGNSNQLINKHDATYHAISEWFGEEVNELSEDDFKELGSLHNQAFSESMDKFKSGRSHGHYMLISGKIDCNELKWYRCLFKIPWLLVLDFDSQENGIHSISHTIGGGSRKIESYLWNQQIKRLDDEYTNWVFLMGTFNEKISDPNFRDWFKMVSPCLKNIRDKIEDFSRNGRDTVVRVLLLWDKNSQDLNGYLEKLLNFFEVNFADESYVKLITCSPEEIPILSDFSMEKSIFNLDIKEALATIWCDTYHQLKGSTGYLLPTKLRTKGNNPNFYHEDILEFALTLDVLYLNNMYPTIESVDDLRNIKESFLKGVGVGWQSWYSIGDGSFAIKRSCYDEIRQGLMDLLKEQERGSMHEGRGSVEILHSPGSGCTTLAMQLLWDIHHDYPCAQVKLNKHTLDVHELADDIINKVWRIYKMTKLPMVLFLDEPDKALMDVLDRKRRSYTAIMLSTKRSINVRENCLSLNSNGKKRFNLVGKLDRSESLKMVDYLTMMNPEKKEEFKMLSDAMLIEYSLVAFCKEFKGLKSFVENVFHELPDEQKTICKFLSFVDVFANSGQFREMELQRFSKLMGQPAGTMLKDQKIQALLEHLVRPSHCPEDSKIRMIHFLFSEEILKIAISNQTDGLHDLALKFIDFVVGDKKEDISQTDQQLLASIFAERDDKKVYYSKLIMELQNDNHREEVFEKLRDILKNDPHAHSHLARFYYHSRNDYEKAEKSFEEAVRLAQESIAQYERKKSPLHESSKYNSKKNPHYPKARIVYNMFAMMDKNHIQQLSKVSDIHCQMNKIVQLMMRSCKHFQLSRSYTTQEFENYKQTYLLDAENRINFCTTLSTNSTEKYFGCFNLANMPLRLDEDLEKWQKDAIKIVNESFDVIEDLISKASCCIYDSDHRADCDLRKANLRYKSVFKTINLDAFSGESLAHRRMWNSALKLISLRSDGDKPPNSDIHGTLTNVDETEHLTKAVQNLELFLNEACKDPEAGELWVERDLREYIAAIRLKNFREDYQLSHRTKPLSIVQNCSKQFGSPLAIFYEAVLNFLIGIGSDKKPVEDYPSFIYSMELFEKLKEKEKQRTIRVSKYALLREYLGTKGEMKRLVRSYKGAPQHAESVERCTGIVKISNEEKDRYGIISLITIGQKTCPKKENGNPIDVYFTFHSLGEKPQLSLSALKGKTVRFNLSFTIENGIEARDVMLLE